MGKTWGRLYAGTRNHRKIKILRDRLPEYWAYWYVLIELAIECDDGGWIYIAPGVPYTIKELKNELGIVRVSSMNRLCMELVSLKLATINEKGLLLNGFAERNFESDNSTPRVRKYREKKKKEGAKKEEVKRFSNDFVTDQNRTEQNRTELKYINILSAEKLVELWNGYCKPKIQVLTKGRKSKIETRLKLKQTEEEWKEIIAKIIDYQKHEQSGFLTFDWLISKDENVLKILEGSYDNWLLNGNGKGKQEKYNPLKTIFEFDPEPEEVKDAKQDDL